ncbi:uncharacterized protein LOC135101650 [Scylla paramamosain]
MWAWWWAVVAWACLVGCSGWSPDGINYNFATPQRRFPDWTLTSPKNVRTHLHSMWEDSSPSYPRLPSTAIRTPMSAPPQLRDNSLLLGEDDYDDAPNSMWLGQSRLHPHRRGSTSLEGLQHLLEGEVRPRVEQVGPQGGAAREEEGTSGVPFSEPHLSQHQLFGEDLDMFPRGGGGGGEQTVDLASTPVQPAVLGQYSYRQPHLDTPGTLSKDILGQLAMEPPSRHSQFPGDFLGQSQLMEEEDLDQLPPDLLPDVQYSKTLPKELILKNLLVEPQLKNGNSQPDMLGGVAAPDYPDHATLPDMLANHRGFGEFMHQHRYADTSQKDELHGLSRHGDEDRTPGWLPSTLSRLNVPSSDTLKKTCHARHLHTCGRRVIEEFSHEPDYSDTCRIREEFLDCMEKEQKEPCRLQGTHFTQTGTRNIIDRIKKLLRSARGCILGHSP